MVDRPCELVLPRRLCMNTSRNLQFINNFDRTQFGVKSLPQSCEILVNFLNAYLSPPPPTPHLPPSLCTTFLLLMQPAFLPVLFTTQWCFFFAVCRLNGTYHRIDRGSSRGPCGKCKTTAFCNNIYSR